MGIKETRIGTLRACPENLRCQNPNLPPEVEDKLTAVSADFQTAGRGTGGRSWHATKAM